MEGIIKNKKTGAFGDLEIRIMPGTFDGPHKGTRTVFSNHRTGEAVLPNGQKITGTLSSGERKALNHIHNQVP